MMYNKPQNVSYTDMAIFIDQHAYDENSTEEIDLLIFEYIYHLAEMLAYKAKFFPSYQLYDDFATYVASSVYMRLKNKRQFEYDENGLPKLKRIKSILNYIKKILYPKKVDFLQEVYDQTFTKVDQDDVSSLDYTFSDYLIDSLDEIQNVNFNLCLGDVPKTISQFINNLPFTDQIFKLNLRFSCILTFMSSVTPKTNDILKLKQLKIESHRDLDIADLIEDQFSLDDVILFHLDNKYKKYVYLLTIRIKHLIANDLSMIMNSQVLGQSALKSILSNEIIKLSINQEGSE